MKIFLFLLLFWYAIVFCFIIFTGSAQASETKWTCVIYGVGQVFCLQQGQEVVWEVSPLFFINEPTRVRV